jgi:DNA-binding winged helix-turn-helix (wHTH) protein
VGDDSLVRCVKDIREALGDSDHRIIKTVPKRGYLFAAEVTATETRAAPV